VVFTSQACMTLFIFLCLRIGVCGLCEHKFLWAFNNIILYCCSQNCSLPLIHYSLSQPHLHHQFEQEYSYSQFKKKILHNYFCRHHVPCSYYPVTYIISIDGLLFFSVSVNSCQPSAMHCMQFFLTLSLNSLLTDTWGGCRTNINHLGMT
jgi:hypothetical protein